MAPGVLPSVVETTDDADQWCAIYQNADGLLEKAVGATEDLRRRLTRGELGVLSAVHASRCPQGPFEALVHYAEFRDLLPPPTLDLDLSPADAPLPAAPTAPSLQVPPLPSDRGAARPQAEHWFAWLAALAAAGIAFAAATVWLLR